MDTEAHVWGVRHAVVMEHAYEESSREPSSQEVFRGKAVSIPHSTIPRFPVLSRVIPLQQF